MSALAQKTANLPPRGGAYPIYNRTLDRCVNLNEKWKWKWASKLHKDAETINRQAHFQENQKDIPAESLEFADILKISSPFHKPGS